MAGVQLSDDVSVPNLNELRSDVMGDSYVRRSVGESPGVKCSNAYCCAGGGQLMKGPEQTRYLPSYYTEDVIVHDAHAHRHVVMDRGAMHESAYVRDSRPKLENEILYLRDKISTLFRENCSLKEQAAKLGINNRTLEKQATGLKQENLRLRDRLQQFSQQLKCCVQSRDSSIAVGNGSRTGSFEMPKSVAENSKMMYSKEATSLEEWNRKSRLSNGLVGSFESETRTADQLASTMLANAQEKKVFQTQQVFESNELLKDVKSVEEDKELLSILESCHSSCDLMKQTALNQNKLLMEMMKNISTTNFSKQEVPVQLQKLSERELVKYLPDMTPPANSNPNLSNLSSVDQLIQKYGAELAQWVGDQNGTSCPEFGEVGNQACDDEWICPMCQAVFPKSVPMLEFETHVMDHFKSDEFEIIPHEGDYS